MKAQSSSRIIYSEACYLIFASDQRFSQWSRLPICKVRRIRSTILHPVNPQHLSLRTILRPEKRQNTALNRVVARAVLKYSPKQCFVNQCLSPSVSSQIDHRLHQIPSKTTIYINYELFNRLFSNKTHLHVSQQPVFPSPHRSALHVEVSRTITLVSKPDQMIRFGNNF